MKSYENPMGDESSLQRVGTMSSKHELLKQIRDAVNPNQRKQNILLMTQAALLSAAVILLAVFALLALFEIEKLNDATDTIIPNLDSIIEDLNQIEEGVDAAYEITKLMPLLNDMNELTGYIKGNLSITVQAMVNSPVLQGGLIGRR
mmetsp:Transcript_2265/g.8172  ORF Transcript_2265/g.8172 Transcript_2265/m.8172 type:complete len:147 (+) Transcript_2265:170-610(+)